MSDYIKREAALALLHKDEFGTPDERWHPESEIAEAILRLPAADVAPVVRCKDCAYAGSYAPTCEPTEYPLKCLGIRYGGVNPDWYCEHGKEAEAWEN